MIGWNSHAKKKKSNSTIAKTKTYHSVEVKVSSSACKAVEDIKEKRFLSSEAPPLPLPECDRNCKCRYVHFDDRRQGDRRDSYAADTSPINDKGDKKNRRFGVDRRQRTSAKSALK